MFYMTNKKYWHAYDEGIEWESEKGKRKRKYVHEAKDKRNEEKAKLNLDMPTH